VGAFQSFQLFAALQLRHPIFWNMKPLLGNLFPTHWDLTVVSSSRLGIPNITLSSLLQPAKHDVLMYTTGYAKTCGQILILSGRAHHTIFLKVRTKFQALTYIFFKDLWLPQTDTHTHKRLLLVRLNLSQLCLNKSIFNFDGFLTVHHSIDLNWSPT
jgi:hypothetical protein